MNTMSSAEFRKTYARLTKATTVTVNGHPIGTWLPYVNYHPAITNPDALPEVAEALAREMASDRYDVRPIRPVPKRK